MRASVIIPVWNGMEYLPACIGALLAQDYPDFEVIVVDNGSTDGSGDWVAERYPQIRLIRNFQNLGFSGGCNMGLRVAQGEVLILLNQDTIVQPGWLPAMVEALRKPEVGAVGCKLLYPDGRTIQHAGGWIEWPLGLAHHYGQGEEDRGQWDEPRPVDYVTGAAVAFRRDVMKQVGLLDEGFWPGYFEDADFCYRVREAGYEIWYVPRGVAIHYETTTLRNPRVRAQTYHRGRLRFVLKHTPPDRFLSVFVPAEEVHIRALITSEGPGPLSAAYMIAVVQAPALLSQRWKAELGIRQQVINALIALYRYCWDIRLSMTTSLENSHGKIALPALSEFQFRSRIPVLGPLIAWFRSFEYGLSSRWAVRHLIIQQETINRLIEARLTEIYQQIEQVVESLRELSLMCLDSRSCEDDYER